MFTFVYLYEWMTRFKYSRFFKNVGISVSNINVFYPHSNNLYFWEKNYKLLLIHTISDHQLIALWIMCKTVVSAVVGKALQMYAWSFYTPFNCLIQGKFCVHLMSIWSFWMHLNIYFFFYKTFSKFFQSPNSLFKEFDYLYMYMPLLKCGRLILCFMG